MSEKIYIVVGLGNPGENYSGTRHNIGFEVVDELARRNKKQVINEKWNSQTASIPLWGYVLHLVKPTTYMNLSGKGVARFVKFYKIPPQRLIVVHDDLDMKTGRLKLVEGGGAGGHNGIRSIIDSIGTKDFFRLKIGIGRPGDGVTVADMPVDRYVLTGFNKEEEPIVRERVAIAVDGLEIFIKNGSAKSMNYLNSFK
jgi:PTH1 family peptidyl-tRNA hydrolase